MAVDADSFITLFIPVHYLEVAAPLHLERKAGKSCLGLLEVLPFLASTFYSTKDLSGGICPVLISIQY